MLFTAFETAAVVVVLASLLGCLNHRFIGLPHTIGLTVMGVLASCARSRQRSPAAFRQRRGDGDGLAFETSRMGAAMGATAARSASAAIPPGVGDDP